MTVDRASNGPIAVHRVAPTPSRDRRGRRILTRLGLVVLIALALGAAGLYLLSERLGDKIARVPDAFAGLDEASRPPASPALTFLLVGTDSRSPQPTTGGPDGPVFSPGAQRSDVVMLARVDPERSRASVVSVPRDSWVEIPGRGPGKINAAYSLGGPALLVRTVESLTDVRVDHFAVVDFAGFQDMVDAVGGVDVEVAQATSNAGVDFRAGPNHLDGIAALAYVRQRYELPGGDLDRARRQLNVVRALLTETVSTGTLTDPLAIYDLLDATSRSVSVDDGLSNGGLRSLALELRDLRPALVTFVSAPVRGLGREGPQSVVYLAGARSEALWAAVRADAVDGYVRRNPEARLDAVLR